MTTLPDWKKQAAATAARDEDIERAFMDQAYGFIQNKAGRLLSDPHRLGFEIVYKNDENTRMVGIFAFRLKDQLLYAPAFFRNGEINGTDLLYLHDRKEMRPLTEDWVEYLASDQNGQQGEGIDKSRRSDHPRTLETDRVMEPQSVRGQVMKYASVPEKEDYQTVWEEMQKSAGLDPILNRFMLEDGGFGALGLLDEMVDKSASFAYHLAQLDPESYAPLELLSEKEQEKSATERTVLALCMARPGYYGADLTKQASKDQFFKLGFALEDGRENSRLNEVVIQEADVDLQNVDGSGVYDLLMPDGKTDKFMVLAGSFLRIPENSNGVTYHGADYQSSDPKYLIRVADQSVRHVYTEEKEPLIGEMVEKLQASSLMKDRPESGGVYVLVDLVTGRCTRPFHVSKIENKNGISHIKCSEHGWDDETIRMNPDLDSGYDEKYGVAGTKCKFVKINATLKSQDTAGRRFEEKLCETPAQGWDSLDKAIRALGAKKTMLSKSPFSDYTLAMVHTDGSAYSVSSEMSAPKMAAYLSQRLRLPGEQAMEVLESAMEKGACTFWMLEERMEKAGSMYLADDPEFSESYDSLFNVPIDYEQGHALEVIRDEEYSPKSRLGDHVDLNNWKGAPKELLMTETPEALAQLAQLHHLPNLFEHGLVGSLTKVFDAMAMLDKYIPDMEKAVDVLGRSLFLFWWKPEEFQKAYGSDDMANLEHELLFNFKSFGDLVLGLLKKSKTRQGMSPMPGSSD